MNATVITENCNNMLSNGFFLSPDYYENMSTERLVFFGKNTFVQGN